MEVTMKSFELLKVLQSYLPESVLQVLSSNDKYILSEVP